VLFADEKVFELPTYTKDLLDSIDEAPIQILHGGIAKEVRVTNNDKRWALRIMKDCCGP